MPRTEIVDPFKESPKQVEITDACADPRIEEILVDGAIRSGKTQVCARIVVGWAMLCKPGLYLVGRRTYPELEDSTKRVFLTGDGGLPPAIPPELIANYQVKHNSVTLKGGSTLIFRALEDDPKAPLKIRNITLSGAFIDQLEEFDSERDKEFYFELLGRLSNPIGPRKMLCAANPAAMEHWAYEHFVQSKSVRKARIHVTLFDNADNLPPDFVARAKRAEATRPEWYRRFVLGEWGAFGGQRFKIFSRERHVVDPFPIPDGWEIIEALDYGVAAPFCCLWIAIDYEGNWWVVGEHYQKEWGLSQHAKAIFAKRRELAVSPSFIYLDPSAFARQGQYESVALELADLHIYAMKAQNDRLGGWARIEELLATDKLKIFSTCTNLLRELPSLRYKDGSDDVDTKMSDHAADALRYGIMSRAPHPLLVDEDIDHDLTKRDRFVRNIHARHKTKGKYITAPY
jgi:PBSX family phage terminase large subunit